MGGGDNLLEDTGLRVTVCDPVKVGDSVTKAYVVYTVKTRTTLAAFAAPKAEVSRRFSDFDWLRRRLVARYPALIVPKLPEKGMIGRFNAEFIEKRRKHLQRFLARIASHPVLCNDDNLRLFLEALGELPKPDDGAGDDGSSSGGAGVLANLSGGLDALRGGSRTDVDPWFDERHRALRTLDGQLKTMRKSIEGLVARRQQLGATTSTLAGSIAVLGSNEEHAGLGEALNGLSRTQEGVSELLGKQAEADAHLLSDTVEEYIGLIAAIEECMQRRLRLHADAQSASASLLKKREQEEKLKAAGRPDKAAAMAAEVEEASRRTDALQRQFEEASKDIKDELVRFERERAAEFQRALVAFVEGYLSNQRSVVTLWQEFLPRVERARAGSTSGAAR